MRIDSKSNLEGIYETNIKKNTEVTENGMNKENGISKDRVEISNEASKYDEISSMKEKVVNEVENGTSPEKLRELKAKIENGTYFIDSRDIAGAILNNGIKGQDIENE